MLMTELTEWDFRAFVGRVDRPSLVGFFGGGSSHCKKMIPVVRALALGYLGRVAFGRVNVDLDPGLAARYEVVSLPTYVLFHGDRHATMLAGGGGFEELAAMLDACFSGELAGSVAVGVPGSPERGLGA